jgi:endonuclease/exonuclease/phosphatase family metal-dependent hydrolase
MVDGSRRTDLQDHASPENPRKCAKAVPRTPDDPFEYDRRPMPRAPRKLVLGLAAWLFGVLVPATCGAASNPCVPMPVTLRTAATSALAPAQDSFTVASLNIAGHARIADTLSAWVQERGFDVLFLQEVGDRSADDASFIAALSDRLGYQLAYASADPLGHTKTQGLAILSRYRLDDVRTYPLEYHRLRFRSRCRIALAATVTTTAGPVRLMNVHLDTRINGKDRIAQLAPLINALDRVDGPQIIGGDFNTMNIRWFWTMCPFPYVQSQAAAVRRWLGRNGFHTPLTRGRATFRFLVFPMRLDWLYLRELEALDWRVDTVRFTDHRGVWTRVNAARAAP